MGKAAHLSRRFVSSLWPLGPSRDDDAWAREWLSPEEERLWARMSRTDRRHAIGVARRVEASLGDQVTTPAVAAALLHDVGKIEARLGVYGRVVATLSAAVAGREMAHDWARTRGYTRRIGLYLLHPKLGGDHLGMTGSDELVERWAREHHLPEDQWTVDLELGRVLRAADDD